MSRFLRTPSPAMVVAVVALSLALVGSAVAGTSTLNKGVSKSKVKKIAKKQIKKAAPGLSVAHADTAAGPAGGALSGNYPDPTFRKNVVPLTLTPGWEPNSGSATPSVWKDGYDVVHFIGSVDRATGTSTQPFTLPAEFRPTTTKFPGVTVGGGFGFLTIDPDGTVIAAGLTPATASPEFPWARGRRVPGGHRSVAEGCRGRRLREAGPAEVGVDAGFAARIGSAPMATADYVIVGAGSAGCVLANRLTEDPSARVLLIEAGGKDRHPNIKIPAAFANQFHTDLDWDFWTEPEPGVDGRSLFIPRGKSLGGSSSMNAMLYVRGRPLDYDLWREQGAPGWGWDNVLPYFLRSEDNVRGASEFHGAGGEMRISEQRSPRKLDRRLIDACAATGIPRIDDYNGPEQDGVSMFQVFQRNGRRWSAADAFLRPAIKRPNLEVTTGATVLGLELDGGRAVGVRYRDKRGREAMVRAGREVILSAGAIGSPQILMLSGIGAGDELREAGVEPRHELPGVGRNLQDHPYLTMLWEISEGPTLYGADKPKHLLEWILRRSGPLTSTAAEVVAFVRSRPGLPAADIQFHMGALYFENHGAEEFDGHAMTIAPVLVEPEGARPRLAAVGRPAREAEDPHQLAHRARGRRLDGRRDA